MERGRHRGESIFDEDEVMDQVAGRLELLPERESRRAKVETLYRACVQIPKQLVLKWACAHIEPSFQENEELAWPTSMDLRESLVQTGLQGAATE